MRKRYETRGYVANTNSDFRLVQKDASPEITLTFTDWTKIKNIIDINDFMKALKDLVPRGYVTVPGAAYKYQFIFPKCLTSLERQKYYSMRQVYCRFYTGTRFVRCTCVWGGIGDRQLGIFVRNF